MLAPVTFFASAPSTLGGFRTIAYTTGTDGGRETTAWSAQTPTAKIRSGLIFSSISVSCFRPRSISPSMS